MLPVPRAGKKKRYSRHISSEQPSEQHAAEQQRVLVQPLGTAGAGSAAGGAGGGTEGGGVQLRRVSGTVAPREGSAMRLPTLSGSSSSSVRSSRLGESPRAPPTPPTPAATGGRWAPRTPKQPSGAAAGTAAGQLAAGQAAASEAAGAAEEPVGAAAVLGSRGTAGRGASPLGLQRVSDHIDQLRQLASNPLDALRRKECQLHITATYLPLTEQELAAMEREAGRQRSGGGLAAMQRVSTLAATSPRIANLLHR